MPVPAQKTHKSPNILIAGGAGFIGIRLAKSLIDRNVKVTIIDDLKRGKEPKLEELSKNPNLSFIQADINKGLPSEFPEPTHIVHLAALETYLYQHEKTNLQNLLTNALGTQNLLKLAHKTKARFVFASSIEVYRGILSSQNLANYFGVSTKEALQFSQAEAKRFAEALVWEHYQKYGIDAVICRLGEVYGPGMDLSSSGTLGKFIKDLLEEKDLTVYGEGTEKEHYVHIGDAVRGLEEALFKPDAEGKIYPICPLKGITVLELAYLVKAASSSKPEIKFKPKALDSSAPEIKIVDGQAQKDLGWKAEISLKEGVKETVRSFMAEKIKAAEDKESADRRSELAHSPSKRDPEPKTSKQPKIIKFQNKFGVAAVRKKIKSILKASKAKIIIIVAFLVALWIFIIGPGALLAWHTTVGTKSLSAAEKNLKALELSKARTEGEQAKESFKKAQQKINRLSLLTTALGLEEDIRSWDYLLNTGNYLSETVINTSEGLQPLVDNLSMLPNTATKIPIDEQEILNYLQEAQRNLLLAEAAANNIPPGTSLSKTLVPLKSRAEEIPKIKQDFFLLKTLTRHFSYLLGYQAPQTYIFLLSDSHEISPIGGRVESFVKLTLKEGKITDFTVDDLENVGEFDNGSLSLGAIRTQFSESYEKAKGESFQTLGAVDLYFLRNLLGITGPVFLPAYNEEVRKDNLLEFSLNRSSKNGRKSILSNLCQKILEKAVSFDRTQGASFLALLKSSLEEKHLSINFENRELNEFLAEQIWDGEYLGAEKDYFFVVDTNIGASKTNYYVKRTINYEANLIQKEATLTVNYIHTGKSNAWPGGPYENLVRVATPQNSELISAKVSQDELESKGEETKQEIIQEEGVKYKILSANFNLKAQKSLSLSFTYRLPEETVSNNIYHLNIQKQPGTDKDPLTVSLVLPTKPQTAQPSTNLKILGNNLSWTWDLEKDREFEVTY